MAYGGQGDLMAKIPAYKQMYASLKKDIQEGKYVPGSFLPTEAELERILRSEPDDSSACCWHIDE